MDLDDLFGPAPPDEPDPAKGVVVLRVNNLCPGNCLAYPLDQITGFILDEAAHPAVVRIGSRFARFVAVADGVVKGQMELDIDVLATQFDEFDDRDQAIGVVIWVYFDDGTNAEVPVRLLKTAIEYFRRRVLPRYPGAVLVYSTTEPEIVARLAGLGIEGSLGQYDWVEYRFRLDDLFRVIRTFIWPDTRDD